MEKCEQLFDAYAGKDEEYDNNLILCQAASDVIYKRFGVKFGDSKPDAPSFNEAKLIGAYFVTVYNSIIEKEKELRTKYNYLKIDIFDIFSIGFTNEVNDENEKNGNIAPFIYHNNKPRKEEKLIGSTPLEKIVQYTVDHSAKPIEIDDAELDNAEKLSNNDKSEILQEIAVKARENLKKIDVNIAKSEIILPVFATIYDTATQSVSERMKANKDFDTEVYFMSTIFIGANEDEELGHVLYVRPNINDKLTLKDDGIATSANE